MQDTAATSIVSMVASNSSGTPTGRELRGFCMDFFAQPGLFEKMQTLRGRLDTDLPLNQRGPSADHRIRGAFVTTHRHGNGSNIEILHLGCGVAPS